MTVTDGADTHIRGWALAPARLAREDVVKLRRLFAAAHAAPLNTDATIALHIDREDTRKLALAKLGARAPHVLVSAFATENMLTVTLQAVHYANTNPDDSPALFVASHKFRRSTPVKEWTRILGRHCRHAIGVLKHARTPTLASIFGVSKVT